MKWGGPMIHKVHKDQRWEVKLKTYRREKETRISTMSKRERQRDSQTSLNKIILCQQDHNSLEAENIFHMHDENVKKIVSPSPKVSPSNWSGSGITKV